MSLRHIKAGTADTSVVIRIIDATDGTPEQAVEHDTAGIAMWYRREGATLTAITEVALAALDTAHTDGGIEHIDDGYYRLDLPDAACAASAVGVMVGGAVTGMIVIGCYIDLVTYDPQDTVRLGLTALPNAAADAAGGLAISDAGGLDLDTKLANTNEVTAARMGALTDWINGGRLDLLLDAIPTTAMRGTDSAALASVATETRLAELDAANLPADVGAIPTTAMRGTDGANTTTPPTTVEIQAEMEQNGASILDTLQDRLTAARAAVLSDWINGGRLDLLLDAIPTTAMRGTDSAALASVATEARLAELDAANLPTDVAAIPTTAMRGTDSAALASVCTEGRLAELAAANLPADVDAVKAKTDNLPEGIQKNQAFSNFTFLMVDSTDHRTPKTGLTVTATRCVDGGAFTAIAGSIAEVSAGIYQVDFLAADTNGDVITYRFTATGADDLFVSIKTTA